MIAQGLTLLLYVFAFATGCMALVLSVVFHIRENYDWTKYFIIFVSSLLIIIVLQVFVVFIHIFASDFIQLVFTYIITPVIIANVTFLIVFIPYFTTWIIGHPFKMPYTLIFYTLSGSFLALSILSLIFVNTTLFSTLSSGIFILSLFFSIGIILKNLKNIASPNVRLICKVIIILSFAMVPLVVLSLIFPAISNFMYPTYFISFSITIMVFLFIYFHQMPHKKVGELTFEMMQKWRITEREYSVVTLIKKGYTNKEIAQSLSISANTVNNHIANIYSKTHVRSRIDLLNLLNEEQ